MPVRQPSQALQHLRRVEDHAAGALHQGLDQDAGELRRAGREQGVERRLRGRIARQVGDDLLRQRRPEPGVHALLGVAHRHGREGVAMVAAAEGDKAGAAALTAVEPQLDGHLHGHLDGDRAGLGEEHPVQAGAQQGAKPARQLQRRPVHQAAEHHMRHDLQLRLDGLADVGVVVAVAGGPPRGHPVDQLAAVLQHDAAAIGPCDRQRIGLGLHLGVGKPKVLQPRRPALGLASHGRRPTPWAPRCRVSTTCSATSSTSAPPRGAAAGCGPWCPWTRAVCGWAAAS